MLSEPRADRESWWKIRNVTEQKNGGKRKIHKLTAGLSELAKFMIHVSCFCVHSRTSSIFVDPNIGCCYNVDRKWRNFQLVIPPSKLSQFSHAFPLPHALECRYVHTHFKSLRIRASWGALLSLLSDNFLSKSNFPLQQMLRCSLTRADECQRKVRETSKKEWDGKEAYVCMGSSKRLTISIIYQQFSPSQLT